MRIHQPGVYDNDNMPEELYHGDCTEGPNIGSSGLRTIINECPARFWSSYYLNPDAIPRETEALKTGKAAHRYILEGGDEFEKTHTVLPEGHDGRTKAGKAVAAEILASGKAVIKRDQYEMIKAMRRAIEQHPIACNAFVNGIPELSAFAIDEETGIWLKARPDYTPRMGAIYPDYKTSVSSNPEEFSKQVARYGYHMQQAHYVDVLEAAGAPPPEGFYFVVQEKKPPYVVTCQTIGQVAMEWGAMLNRKAIRIAADCLNSGRWPGYSDKIEVAELPYWAVVDLERKKEFGYFSKDQENHEQRIPAAELAQEPDDGGGDDEIARTTSESLSTFGV